ncbi:MAG: hypothetical protein EAX90_15545 [Candidatus Heimdallarchaeota archaeon]|nr:hypothetical protein [Candidatus Heimdallarchaeota archaeon]
MTRRTPPPILIEISAFCIGIITIGLGSYLMATYYIDVFAGSIIIVFGIFYILGGITSIINRRRKREEK